MFSWSNFSCRHSAVESAAVETPTYLAVANKLFWREERADIVAFVAADPECGT